MSLILISEHSKSIANLGLQNNNKYVRAPPPGPLRRGVVPLTGYRGMSHALFFRLRESSNPRPKGHIEMGSTLTTNWATCPMPFSFASVRARTQDQRDILKWGALSLPTELAQLVVRVLPISICPFGLGFELSRRRKKRAWDMPL